MLALGHGRSVAVMCALLVALNVAEDWKNAEKLIRDKRPYIQMNSLHRKALDEWSMNRLSAPKREEEVGVSSEIFLMLLDILNRIGHIENVDWLFSISIYF
ncbi:hypothetical protein CsSME_00000354 [Camellia sinensis var. sinensis]